MEDPDLFVIGHLHHCQEQHVMRASRAGERQSELNSSYANSCGTVCAQLKQNAELKAQRDQKLITYADTITD